MARVYYGVTIGRRDARFAGMFRASRTDVAAHLPDRPDRRRADDRHPGKRVPLRRVPERYRPASSPRPRRPPPFAATSRPPPPPRRPRPLLRTPPPVPAAMPTVVPRTPAPVRASRDAHGHPPPPADTTPWTEKIPWWAGWPYPWSWLILWALLGVAACGATSAGHPMAHAAVPGWSWPSSCRWWAISCTNSTRIVQRWLRSRRTIIATPRRIYLPRRGPPADLSSRPANNPPAWKTPRTFSRTPFSTAPATCTSSRARPECRVRFRIDGVMHPRMKFSTRRRTAPGVRAQDRRATRHRRTPQGAGRALRWARGRAAGRFPRGDHSRRSTAKNSSCACSTRSPVCAA